MNNSDVCDLLNSLLEAERAGAKAAVAFRRDHAGGPGDMLIEQVRKDEAWCCGMLSRWVQSLGGTPSTRTGDFLVKVLAKDGLEARLGFLNRGQGWVVRKLQEAIPSLDSGELRADLGRMLAMHEVNIAACDAFLAAGGGAGA